MRLVLTYDKALLTAATGADGNWGNLISPNKLFGLTAPNEAGVAQKLHETFDDLGADEPLSISAHANGTSLGDATEKSGNINIKVQQFASVLINSVFSRAHSGLIFFDVCGADNNSFFVNLAEAMKPLNESFEFYGYLGCPDASTALPNVAQLSNSSYRAKNKIGCASYTKGANKVSYSWM